MKKLFITLFLMVSSLAVFGQDYYWYNGEKIPLERGVRKYIIYEDDLLKESDKAQIVRSEDVFYDEIPNLKWGVTRPHANIEDTAHVHYCTISYRKDGDYYDNMYVTHRFYVRLKDKNDLSILKNMADHYSAEIESEGAFQPWYILRCKLKSEYNALELANIFYESGLYSATEPEMINAFLPEFPKTIKSLCDEWNVLHEPFECIGSNCFLQTIIYRLATDTLIQDKHYVKLMSEEGSSTTYKGALREGTNRDIYYVPENSTNEYLIYAFNAQVGDELENVWLGGEEERDYCINAHNATVIEISNSNPRIFTLEIIPTTSYEDKEIYPYRMNWIEGIGMSDGPVGSYDRNQLCTAAADMGVYSLLCAYMEGEQVYTSEMGQKYGCYYDGNVPQTDTIPLFIKDGPGSSTVQPVDPNEIVATLQHDVLSIFEFIGKEIGYKLTQTSSSSNAPAGKRLVKSDTFHESVAVTLTENGTYLLELTHPDWDYTIVGTFEYMGGENAVINTEATVPSARKIMRDGQLLIRKGDKIYTLTGVQIQ